MDISPAEGRKLRLGQVGKMEHAGTLLKPGKEEEREKGREGVM